MYVINFTVTKTDTDSIKQGGKTIGSRHLVSIDPFVFGNSVPVTEIDKAIKFETMQEGIDFMNKEFNIRNNVMQYTDFISIEKEELL